MGPFRDNRGFYHDTNETKSNNPWIYTAIAHKLNLDIGLVAVGEVRDCFVDGDFWIQRRPETEFPPISRDEIIGMISLTLNKDLLHKLIEHNFNLSRHNNGSYLRAALELVKIRNEHRNTVWKRRLVKAYPLAFQLMPHDIYYIKKSYGLNTKWYEFLFFNLYVLMTLLQKNYSAKNVLFVQVSDLGWDKVARVLNVKNNIDTYFKEDHPFRKALINPAE